jgi:hypothetical protein
VAFLAGVDATDIARTLIEVALTTRGHSTPFTMLRCYGDLFCPCGAARNYSRDIHVSPVRVDKEIVKANLCRMIFDPA